MTLLEYINSLSEADQERYAVRCGTTLKYLRGHIKGATRIPRPALLRALSAESGGAVGFDSVLEHFGLVPTAA